MVALFEPSGREPLTRLLATCTASLEIFATCPSVKFYLRDDQVLHLLCIHGRCKLLTVRSISVNGVCT